MLIKKTKDNLLEQSEPREDVKSEVEEAREKPVKKFKVSEFPTLKIKTDRDIAMDFAEKVYRKFDKMVKAVALFGSTQKNLDVAGSDIDIVVIIDDATIKFDEKLIAWYREEIADIVQHNPYRKELHINTIKLTTWWGDLIRGDPTIINIIRYGDALIDFGGFFNPLKMLLEMGRIKPSPESIYTALNRVPYHILRSKQSEISAIEGCYWAMVDSSHALLMSIKVLPPSPEHIPILLKEHFVDKKLLHPKYVVWVRDLQELHKKVMHGEIKDIEGSIIDGWQQRADEFFKEILRLIDKILE